MDANSFISMGIKPIKIDVLTSIPGVSFKEVYDDAFDYKEENVSIKVIHINHLISNKTASGRPKDIDDVQALKKIQKQFLGKNKI